MIHNVIVVIVKSLWAGRSRVLFPTWARNFFSEKRHISCRAQPVIPVGCATGTLSPGFKQPGREGNHSSHSVPT